MTIIAKQSHSFPPRHAVRRFACSLGVASLFLHLAGAATLPAAAAEPKVSIVVGNQLPAEGGPQDAPPSPLESPFGVDFDPEGNMFIVELEGGRVHRLDAAGKLTKIAGDGSKSYRGDGGPAAQATFNGMHNVAVTPAGDIYIADTWNNCIRKIDKATGVITTIAGAAEPGFADGPGDDARFNYVMCVTLTPANDALYVADINNRRIRKVDLKTNQVSTIAGNGQRGVPQNGAAAIDSPLVDPRAVAVDSKGLVYILERGGNALRTVSPDGRIQTVAGDGQRGHQDGPALAAQFGAPKHLCLDDAGNVYIADDVNGCVRKYDPRTNTVSTVIGRGHGNPPLTLKNPHGVCIEKSALYVVDMGNDRILRVDF